MAASKVTLQSALAPWVRTTASEVHSQQSLVRAARHDPCTERTRFGHAHVTRAALRCPCVPGGLGGNDEPAAHLAAAQLRVERPLFPRLTRATAWRARLAGARIARARAVGRSASRPQQIVAAQRAARGLDPTAHRDRAEGCCGAPTSRWDGSVPSQSRAVRAPRAGSRRSFARRFAQPRYMRRRLDFNARWPISAALTRQGCGRACELRVLWKLSGLSSLASENLCRSRFRGLEVELAYRNCARIGLFPGSQDRMSPRRSRHARGRARAACA